MSATGLRNGYHQDTLTSIRRSRERGQHGASAGAGQQSNSLRETSDFSSSTSTLNSGKDAETNCSAHWIYKPASVIIVAVAIGSAAALSKVAISNGHCNRKRGREKELKNSKHRKYSGSSV